MRCNPANSLGGDLLATALHREEKERKIAEGRAKRGLEPRFVYNFPRTPLECLYSLENALGESKLVRPASSSSSSRSKRARASVRLVIDPAVATLFDLFDRALPAVLRT